GLWPLPPALESEAGRNAAPIRAYRFLNDRATRKVDFVLPDLDAATGWTGDTARTYATKQWRQFLQKQPSGSYRVTSRFLRLTERDFLRNFTQSRQLLGKYARKFHQALVSYEFLLPLTNERILRSELDRLFYTDTVLQRIDEIGLGKLEGVVPRSAHTTDDEYRLLICTQVG